MSIDDEIKKIEQERITGPSPKETVTIEENDPSYGSKDSKDSALKSIEDELAAIKKDVKEILRLLKQG